MADPQTLPAMVRAKYPGVYDDLSDAELDAKVRAKFPGQYDDLPKPSAAPVVAKDEHMSAALPGSAYAPFGALPRGVGPKAREFLDTPLAHTGVDAIDSMTSPGVIALTATTLGLAASRAAALPANNILLKAKAAMSAVGEAAAPAIKYEAAKHGLMFLKVPESLATVIALGVSGYKGKGKAPAEGAPESPPAASVSLDEANAAAKAARATKFGTEPAAAPTAAAPVAAAPAASAPQSAPAPAASVSPDLKSLMASGMKPTEAARALKLLRQGATPAEVEQTIVAARPSPPSVASPSEPSPIQRMTGIKPDAPASNAQVTNALGIAARRAKVSLSDAELDLLRPLVKQGMTPEDAITHLPAIQLQQLPGVLTPDQMNAEIAARVGNRSPSRK